MNKLFIIGNGFDLAHGLKTSYQDFIVWYLRKTFTVFIQKFTYEDGLLRLTFGRTVFPPYEINSIKDFFDVVNRFNIKIDHKYQFFEKLISIQQNHFFWVDIEIYYYKHLINLSNQNIRNPNSSSSTIKQLTLLNDCLYNIKLHLIDYLKEVELQGQNKIISIDKIISSEVNASLKKNKNNFMKNISNTDVIDIDSILFCSFNYTNFIENYTDFNRSINEIRIEKINIHGSLNDQNKIIFGYGDEMDENYKIIEKHNENEYLKNMKSFGYFHSENYQKLLEFLEVGKYEIHLMGHSCGLSDRVLLNPIWRKHEQSVACAI